MGKQGLVMKYFVLKPIGDTPHARASRFAMYAYANDIEHYDAKLAEELRNWVEKEEDTPCPK